MSQVFEQAIRCIHRLLVIGHPTLTKVSLPSLQQSRRIFCIVIDIGEQVASRSYAMGTMCLLCTFYEVLK